MIRTTADVLRETGFQVTAPLSLDLAGMHGNDYSTINRTPHRLWDFWESEGAILGQFGRPDMGWGIAYPGVQYVQDHPDSVHVVIAPRRDRFVTPRDLSIEDTTQAAVFIQHFLESRDTRAFAGYNIGPELGGSQMWWSWHIHLVQFNETELAPLEKTQRILWEPWPDHISAVMSDMFIPQLLESPDMPPAENIDLSSLDQFGFSSAGSCLLRFAPDLEPAALARVMQTMDVAYKDIHTELKSTFFTPEAQKRNKDDIQQDLAAFTIGRQLNSETADSLLKFSGVLPEILPATPSLQSPLTLPNYSVAFMQNESGVYFLFQPHLLRKKASALSSLGVYLRYTLGTNDQLLHEYHTKKNRSRRVIAQINNAIHQMSRTA